MKKVCYTLVSVMLVTMVSAQEGRVILTNNKPVEANRYKNVSGSPYLYEDFVSGTIYENKKNFIPNLKLNYNGETESFEYLKNGEVYELDVTFFIQVEMYGDKYQKKYSKYMSDTTTFIKGLNSDDYTKFYILVQGGPNATVFREFNVYMSERDLQNVGQTIKIKNFGSQFLYYVVKGGEPQLFKLNKKSILNVLDGGKTVDTFVKKNKLKLDNEAELIRLLTYYNSLEVY